MSLISVIYWCSRSNLKVLFVVAGNCEGLSRCGPNQYRGTDCKCYCKSDNINDPVELCPEGES